MKFRLDLGFPALGVFLGPVALGLIVAQDMAVAGVALEVPARAVSDVAQVAHESALVCLEDLGVADRGIVVADRRQEVLGVREVSVGVFRLLRDQIVALVVDGVGPFRAQVQSAPVAIEGDEAGAVAVVAQAGPGDGSLAFEFVADGVGVGSLLVVVEEIAAAAGGHLGRVVDAHSPTAQVKGVDAVVAQLSVAPVPVPVPVVVDQVVLVGNAGGRSLPELVVQVSGDGCRFAAAQRAPAAVVPGANHVDAADGPFPQLLNGLACPRRASPLGAHLDRPVVLAGGGDHELALAGGVAARFLHVCVLSGGAGQDGGRSVPVVGPGVEESVHLGIVQNPPEVSDFLRRPSGLLLDRVGHLVQTARIDVADVLDVDVGLLSEALGQTPAPAHPHDSDDDPGVGRIVLDVAPGGDR